MSLSMNPGTESLSREERRLSMFLVFSVLALLAWSSLFQVDRIVRAEGRFVTASRPQVIQHLEGGIVAEILVSEGSRVEAGEAMMRLSKVQAASNVQTGQSRLVALLGQMGRLRAESLGQAVITFDQRVTADIRRLEEDSLRQRRVRRSAEITVLRETASQRRASLDETEKRARSLFAELQVATQQRAVVEGLFKKGAASQLEILEARGREERLSTQHKEAVNAAPRLRASIAEANAKVADAVARHLDETQAELTQVAAEVRRIEAAIGGDFDRLSRTDLVAPATGYVNRVYVSTVGGVVKPGESLFEITPTEGPLRVEARVRPDDRASLIPGLPAKVIIGAYDFAVYGSLEASIAEVSADTVPDEQGRRHYRVLIDVSMPSGRLAREAILPGMTARADIVLGQRTIFSFLVSPLLRFSSEAFREK